MNDYLFLTIIAQEYDYSKEKPVFGRNDVDFFYKKCILYLNK